VNVRRLLKRRKPTIYERNIKMIYPTIEKLTGGEFNRYELVIGVAKGARIVTDKYVEMRQKAQKMIENHETDKPLAALIDPEYKDQKAVKVSVAKIERGEFRLVRGEEQE
jgi:DNA-directed RNA polymerase subunit K/omega